MIDFLQEASGNVAVATALAAIPVVGAMGVALDHVRLSDMRAEMQAEADADALSKRNGVWLDDVRYEVVRQGRLDTSIMAVLGLTEVDFTVRAVARHVPPVRVYGPPAYMYLDGDAMDYNRIGVYCYNKAENTRSEIVILADNRGRTFDVDIPQCGPGESFELALHNVWYGEENFNNPALQRYYKTDTGVPDWQNANKARVLETYLCDTEQECYPVSMGGPLPEGPNRVPHIETRPCEPGHFMYYGWEDTPESFGDSDFNDIRLIMACPDVDETTREVRLIE
ncbi:hypothetical protein GCM10007276_17950 [Agaricicola taiwanensis]|uniref:Uncharacterized protein n=2 Tax=Agaricicola taiwanensis TaxID=591372 RepID=A0A8J2W2E2_9RHOB|nr:hypothetical protein GCM10007276_17950 [Agaricicola taiwanensis]